MKRSYYKLDMLLRPGWNLPQGKTLKIEGGDLRGLISSQPPDPSRWPEPPHVFLANLGYDPERQGGAASDKDVERFTRFYGPLDVVQGAGAVTQQPVPADPVEAAKRVLATTRAEEHFWLSLDNFRFLQAQLRAAWKEQNGNLFTDPKNFGKALGYDLLPMSWHINDDGLEMHPASCYAYMGILLTRDLAEGRALLCQNPHCDTPFFVATRKRKGNGKWYCSNKCAVAISVQNFRQRKKSLKRKKRRKK